MKVLVAARFDFVVIGGVAASAHGSALMTVDLDVVAPFDAKNLGRLMSALSAYQPRFAHTPERRPITQAPEELAAFKNLYIATALGRLDVLSTITGVGAYAQVLPRAATVELSGVTYRVLGLDDLIAAKAALGRPKDKQVELELKAIRDRLRGGKP
ncbi:MAG: hypothetical protein ACYC8T_28380 [Myxococcaceae bacterium]